MGDIAFVVRSLPGASLKGAFRIHIPPEALIQLRLKVGDLCTIVAEDGTRGPAIAWRATEKMGTSPKIQPVKMTETLRDACGFKQGTQVRIEKSTNTEIRPAKRVVLTEITPVEYDGPEDDCWKIRCIGILATCDAFCIGTTFDVHAGEGIKKRYFVEQIDFEDESQQDPTLARICDTTELQLVQESPSVTPMSSQREFQLDDTHIGGLQTQIAVLNERIRGLCNEAKFRNVLVGQRHASILLHGYRGTGKSLLLGEIAKSRSLNKIIRLEQHQLLGTPTKNHIVIHNAFHDAKANEPSLILIDDLDKIIPANDQAASSTATSFATAFESIKGHRVMVIGTASSVSVVNQAVTTAERLSKWIELPIPDAPSRKAILKALLPFDQTATDEIVTAAASRSHGFTGQDLARVLEEAVITATLRSQNHSNWVQVEPHLPVALQSRESVDDRASSVASTLIERTEPQVVQVSMADMEKALEDVHPSALQELIIEPPKVTFKDIGGSESLRTRFEQIILWPMEHPELYEANPGHKPKRGILLYGPPGCSKTMTAQAVASTFGWNFIAVKGSELISMYVGESERAIREIFRKARQAAPTIIFFDEIDSIATARSDSADASKSLNVVTTLLNEMDGFSAMKNVLVLAATNKPASLDPAILRAGRFDVHIYLGPPDADARRDIIHLCSTGAAGGQNLSIGPLVEKTEGMSGAEIKNAWDTAWDMAISDKMLHGKPLAVTTEGFLTAIASTHKAITAEMLHDYQAFGARGH